MFKKICTAIECPKLETALCACRRVAKTSSDRRRNILVTPVSARLRDLEILSATHRFNKAHCKVTLDSEHADIAGERRRIYITEHLSRECEKLHAAARKYARENNCKYVWVKFGRVYLREDDSGSVFRIRDIAFLNKLDN
ncbi:hypothetical protein EVAR_46568_1 [Eumeta japonica]|uniref:FP protein C-terminal domain-containing protein n=1 Tax=Eumeta variegata TaxID=151549 RepID=A0A4C1XR47_EUMVA|nr:hypothetical protein EVAR_46568_1 [Eumeta japonica]